MPAAQDARGVVPLLHGDAAAAHVTTGRMPDHHHKVFQVGQLAGDHLYGIITGGDKRGAQEQVFGRIAADRQLGRQQQARTLRVGGAGGFHDFAGIARHVAHGEIELGTAKI